MTRFFRMMAVGAANNPIVPGTITVIDANAARTATNYFAVAQTGTTAQRPLATDPDVRGLPAGLLFFDTTVGGLIVFDGATWRSPITGAAV